MKVINNIYYIGVNDHKIDLFEGQFKVANGMSYNSYIIKDEKIAVLDTIDINFTEEWLNNIEIVLDNKLPDYLIIHHMEPDHSASIKVFMEKYPNTKIVSSALSFNMMKNLFQTDFPDNKVVVKDGTTLNLGETNLTFITAPNVHWPEVLMSYEEKNKVLFSADGFGKFGALDVNEDWEMEAKRYYFGIVGKFGINVQQLLSKASNLDIKMICPLHGPVLNDNLNYYLDLYNNWSSYKSIEGITICYTSVYGNTLKAVNFLYNELLNKGYKNINIYDLARKDISEAISSAFTYNKLVLATTTYNNDIFPFMHDFITRLIERNYQNKQISIIENGLWNPIVNKVITNLFKDSINITYTNPITIKGSITQSNKIDLINLSNELTK